MTMLTGSAVWGAALAASIAIVVLVSIAARRRYRWVWAVPVLLQPVVVLGAVGYPGLLLATACMTAGVSGLVEYFRKPRLNSLTNGALALGALVLLDWDMTRAAAAPFPVTSPSVTNARSDPTDRTS